MSRKVGFHVVAPAGARGHGGTGGYTCLCVGLCGATVGVAAVVAGDCVCLLSAQSPCSVQLTLMRGSCQNFNAWMACTASCATCWAVAGVAPVVIHAATAAAYTALAASGTSTYVGSWFAMGVGTFIGTVMLQSRLKCPCCQRWGRRLASASICGVAKREAKLVEPLSHNSSRMADH